MELSKYESNHVKHNQPSTTQKTTSTASKVSEICKKFSENTTAHGFGQIQLANRFAVKCLWVLIMVGCGVVLIMQIYPLIVRFTRKPTATKITMVTERVSAFPVIVICNENMIKKSLHLDLLNDSNINYDPLITLDDGFAFGVGTGQPFDVPTQPLYQYGHTFYETVVRCRWKNTEECYESMWQEFWHYRLGLCFAFNSGFEASGKDSAVRNVTRTGPGSALEMTVDVKQEEYLIEYTETAGMRLYIGDQGVMYEPHQAGINLSPGFAYSIPLRKKIIKRVDPFHNESCVKNKQLNLASDTMGQKVITKYSMEICYQSCLATQMHTRCGCIDYWIPKMLEYQNVSICNKTDKSCLTFVTNLYASGNLPCLKRCNPPCDQVTYDYHVTMRRYPVLESPEFEYARENMLKVSLYFQNLEYEYIEDYMYYLMEDLLGDIGGQMGLFNGYSVLTIVEIVVLVGHILGLSFYTCFKK